MTIAATRMGCGDWSGYCDAVLLFDSLDVDGASAGRVTRIWLLIEADLLTFLQHVEITAQQGRAVKENVVSAGCSVGRDEAKAFVVTQCLDGASSHLPGVPSVRTERVRNRIGPNAQSKAYQSGQA